MTVNYDGSRLNFNLKGAKRFHQKSQIINQNKVLAYFACLLGKPFSNVVGFSLLKAHRSS